MFDILLRYKIEIVFWLLFTLFFQINKGGNK